MDNPNPQSNQGRILLLAAAFVVIAAVMRTAEPVIVPVLLSIFIAVITTPPMFWLQGKGVPHVLGLILVITGMFVIVIAMMALVGTSLQGFTQDLPT
jgi:predicted PurR-regulated permease PerM